MVKVMKDDGKLSVANIGMTVKWLLPDAEFVSGSQPRE